MTQNTHPEVSGFPNTPADKSTPRPWEVIEIETRDDHGRYLSYGVCTASGAVVMDATNSSVAVLEWEHDGEPAGSVHRWDEKAKHDAHLIVTAVNAYPALLKCRVALADVHDWASARCPCEGEKPDPCPLCGARVDSGDICKSAEATLPRSVLAQIREALALLSPSQDKPGNSDSTGVPPDNRPALPYRDGGE